MMQVIQQTKEEKIAMYMKCTKKQLAEMLVACNVFIESVTPTITWDQVKRKREAVKCSSR